MKQAFSLRYRLHGFFQVPRMADTRGILKWACENKVIMERASSGNRPAFLLSQLFLVTLVRKRDINVPI